MNRVAASLLVLCLLASCRMTESIKFEGTDREVLATPTDDGGMSITVATTTHIDSQKGEINLQKSFAQNAKGQKFRFIQVKNEWSRENYKDASRRTPSDTFWLADPAFPDRRMGWSRGHWRLHIVLDAPGGTRVFNATFEYSQKAVPIFSRPN
jgi:hypothetical protein